MSSPIRISRCCSCTPKLEVLDGSLRGKLRLYALLAPHIAGYGAGNSGWCSEVGGIKLFRAGAKNVHLVMACSTGFSRRSVGYVGFSDGWQDLDGQFQNGLGISQRRERQHRVDRGNQSSSTTVNSASLSHLAAATKAQLLSCSNRWPSRFESHRQATSASGSARLLIQNSISALTRPTAAEYIG